LLILSDLSSQTDLKDIFLLLRDELKIVLPEDEKSTIEECLRNYLSQIIVLEHKAFKEVSVKDLRKIFISRPHTIYDWIHGTNYRSLLACKYVQEKGLNQRWMRWIVRKLSLYKQK
jgi:hypothetical protein